MELRYVPVFSGCYVEGLKEDFPVFKESSTYHRFILLNATDMKDGVTRYIWHQVKKNNITLYMDSGGIQLVTKPKSKSLSLVSANNVAKIYEEFDTDYGFILDVPPFLGKNKPFWGKDFTLALELTIKYSSQLIDRLNKTQPIGIVQGVIPKQITCWYNRVKEIYEFDYWAVKWGITRTQLYLMLGFAIEVGIPNLHILGFSNLTELSFLFPVIKDAGFQILSFDSKTVPVMSRCRTMHLLTDDKHTIVPATIENLEKCGCMYCKELLNRGLKDDTETARLIHNHNFNTLRKRLRRIEKGDIPLTKHKHVTNLGLEFIKLTQKIGFEKAYNKCKHNFFSIDKSLQLRKEVKFHDITEFT